LPEAPKRFLKETSHNENKREDLSNGFKMSNGKSRKRKHT
jgi:hypothetical protein